MYIVEVFGPLASIRQWNELFPIGTEVHLGGVLHKTESHASLGMRKVPVVFIDGVEEPVPLAMLQVPGYTSTPLTRSNKKAAS